MAIFGNMSITNAGLALYAKAQAGKSIVFTRMQIGSGQIGTQNPATLTSLVNPQWYVPITSITPNTILQTATISGIISNSAITTATYICEIGLYAEDPDAGEILYGYASAGTEGDYMAPASQGAYSWNYQINAAVGNAANITANISSSVYDNNVVISDTTLSVISGGNQKSINKSIDTLINSSILALKESTGYGVISGLTVTAQSAPNMTVNVASGIVHMANGVRLAPSGNSALAINTADTTNTRIDIVYVNANSTIGYTAGTPASTPVAPSTPVGAFLLAQINVSANSTTITSANIVDQRKIKNTTDSNANNIASHEADDVSHEVCGTDNGTANTYTLTVTTSPAPTSWTAGMTIKFKAKNTNTGASTLSIVGISGSKSLVTNVNTALVANAILAGQEVIGIYDGANVQLIPMNYIASSPIANPTLWLSF